MKGPRGIAKEVTIEKSRTIVYHFTADDLRKRLKLPESARIMVQVPDEIDLFKVDDKRFAGVAQLDVEVKE